MYWKIFKNSILLPKKDALFYLNRVPMGKTLLYILFLMHLAFLPNLIKFSKDLFQQYEHISYSLFVINVMVIYPFITVFIMITSVSTLSFLAWLFAKLLQRKLAYQYLWKITAYALTTPLLLYALIEICSLTYSLVVSIPFLILYFIIYKIIMIYPKRTNRSRVDFY